MDLPDWIMSAGLLAGFAGTVLTVREVRRLRRAGEQPQPRSARYLEGIAVLVSQALILGGIALIQFGNVAGHISDNTRPAHVWLSFVSGAGIVLLFGFQLGRLVMRWQMNRLLTELDMERREAELGCNERFVAG